MDGADLRSPRLHRARHLPFRDRLVGPQHHPPAPPPRPPAVAAAVRAAIADPGHVLDEARTLRERGEHQLALHVVDLLALDTSDAPEVLEARQIKAELAEELAASTSSFIAANLYRTMADYPHRRALD